MKKFVLFSLLLGLSEALFAQFNTRISLESSLGYNVPLYLNFARQDKEGFPHFFPNFRLGANISSGLYFRINRKLSIGSRLSYYYFTDWQDPIEVTDTDNLRGNAKIDLLRETSEFQIGELSMVARYNFFADSRFSPFVIGGLGVYAYQGFLLPRAEIITRVENPNNPNTSTIKNVVTVLRFDPKVINTQLAWGFQAGFGLDFNMSRYLTFYWQASYQSLITISQPVLKLNTHFMTQNLGIRVNIFRKKSLL